MVSNGMFTGGNTEIDQVQLLTWERPIKAIFLLLLSILNVSINLGTYTGCEEAICHLIVVISLPFPPPDWIEGYLSFTSCCAVRTNGNIHHSKKLYHNVSNHRNKEPNLTISGFHFVTEQRVEWILVYCRYLSWFCCCYSEQLKKRTDFLLLPFLFFYGHGTCFPYLWIVFCLVQFSKSCFILNSRSLCVSDFISCLCPVSSCFVCTCSQCVSPVFNNPCSPVPNVFHLCLIIPVPLCISVSVIPFVFVSLSCSITVVCVCVCVDVHAPVLFIFPSFSVYFIFWLWFLDPAFTSNTFTWIKTSLFVYNLRPASCSWFHLLTTPWHYVFKNRK